MALQDTAKPFGLREVRIKRGATNIALPVARTMTFTPEVVSGEMQGDDETVALTAFERAVEFSLEAGGISLEAWALMTGRTVVEAGSTPNETRTLTAESGAAGNSYPYFEIWGRSVGDDADDIWLHIFDAKLMSSPQGSFQGDQFFVTSLSGKAINRGDGLYEVVQHETATALPTS
jgi:hypothetical protein